MPSHSVPVVRPASTADQVAVTAMVRRLAAFTPPSWRSAEEVVAAEVRTLQAFFGGASPESSLLIAERETGAPLGFVFLERVRDYFTGERHGHIAMLAVTDASEGTGVGRSLMEAAERWAEERHFTRLTLNVFEGNHRARGVYEHLGYRPETLRYFKKIGRRGGS